MIDKVQLNKKILGVSGSSLNEVNSEQTLKTPLRNIFDLSSNVKVTEASIDLDKLVGRLNIETSNSKENAAKTTLGSAFTTVLSRLKERKDIAESNIKILDEASNVGKEIDAIDEELKDLNSNKSSLEKKLSEYEAQIEKLNSEAEEVSTELEAVEAEIERLMQSGDPNAEKKIEELTKKKASLEYKLSSISVDLSTAKMNLGQVQMILGATKQKIAEKMSEKDIKKERLKQLMSEIKDEEILKEIADALRMSVSDVRNLIEEHDAERSDEEEEWLEENSPIKIIQEMLNEIDEKREEMA